MITSKSWFPFTDTAATHLRANREKKTWRRVQALGIFQQLLRSLPNSMSPALHCSFSTWLHQNICSSLHSEKTNLSTSTQLLFPKIYLYFWSYESSLRAPAPWKWPRPSNCLSTPRVWQKPVKHAVGRGMSPYNLKLPSWLRNKLCSSQELLFLSFINLFINLHTVKLILLCITFCEFWQMLESCNHHQNLDAKQSLCT